MMIGPPAARAQHDELLRAGEACRLDREKEIASVFGARKRRMRNRGEFLAPARAQAIPVANCETRRVARAQASIDSSVDTDQNIRARPDHVTARMRTPRTNSQPLQLLFEPTSRKRRRPNQNRARELPLV